MVRRKETLRWGQFALALTLFIAVAILGAANGEGNSDGDVGGALAAAVSGVSTLVSEGRRYAYVLMHYEGTSRDAEYLLGLRVSVASLRLTHTEFDIVVLLSESVSAETRALLKSDNVILRDVDDIPNPYAHGKRRFMHALNKIWLWNMTEYDRVIYLDSDTIAVGNMDQLALCGHFCVVFMNPCNFHTGVMVVRPDTAQFDRMVQAVANTWSYDGADQGFLTAYFTDAANGPLFDPSNGLQSSAPINRLAPGYNLNAMWYLEKLSWDLYRCFAMFRDLDVPGLSIGYPIAPQLKPWYWYGYIYLWDVWHLWYDVRAVMDARSYADVFLLFFVANCALLAGGLWISRFLQVNQPYLVIGFNDYVRTRLQRLQRSGRLSGEEPSLLRQYLPNLIGVAVGLFSLATSTLLPLVLIPGMTPPRMAWFLWGMSHSCINFFQILMVYTFCIQSSPMAAATRSHQRFRAAAAHVAPTLVSELLILLVGYLHLYPNAPFTLGKAVVYLYVFHLGLLLQVNGFRSVVASELELSSIKKTRSQIGVFHGPLPTTYS